MVVTITSDICSLPLVMGPRRHDATHVPARATVVRDGEGEYAAPTSVAARGTRRRQAAPPHTDATPGSRRGRRHGAAGLRRTVGGHALAAHRPFGRGSGRGVMPPTSASSRVPRAG